MSTEASGIMYMIGRGAFHSASKVKRELLLERVEKQM